jgi:hypothetical protein
LFDVRSVVLAVILAVLPGTSINVILQATKYEFANQCMAHQFLKMLDEGEMHAKTGNGFGFCHFHPEKNMIEVGTSIDKVSQILTYKHSDKNVLKL